MISWRMDLTVLTDLSASMFAACFVMLLIFLSIEQGEPADPDAPVVVVIQPVLSPQETVRLLHAHDARSGGASVDLFADRVELRAGQAHAVLRGDVAAGLARALPAGGPVRLYVFSHAFYGEAIAALRRQTISQIEISVPLALRDAGASQLAWNREFVRLGESDLTLPAFHEALAALLEGRTRPLGSVEGRAAGGSRMAEGREAPGLVARLRQWLVTFATIAFPLSGLMAVLWIETGPRRPVATAE